MPAIYRNLQSKCKEIIQFSFMWTICTQVQIGTRVHIICTTSKAGANLHPGANFENTVHMAKNTPRVQICAHERGFSQQLLLLTWTDIIISIILTRIRHNCSSLNADLNRVDVVPSSACTCGAKVIEKQ